MLVSIIIPLYNVGEYLRQCLDSVLALSYTDIEIIVVDDGSTDNSIEVLEEYTDRRIKKIRTPNQGVTAARKTGWQNSTGDYCLFLDADDMLTVDSVSYFVTKLKEGDYDFIQGWYDVVDGEGYIIPEYFPYTTGEYTNKSYINHAIETIGDFQSIWIGIYKRTVITEKVFEIDRSFHRGEDALALLGILNNCDKILLTDKVFYRYFQRIGSASRNPIDVRYIYKYNKFRYMVPQKELQGLIEFNTLQRLIGGYLRLNGSDAVTSGDKDLLIKLKRSSVHKKKSLKLRVQLFIVGKSYLEYLYRISLKCLSRLDQTFKNNY